MLAVIVPVGEQREHVAEVLLEVAAEPRRAELVPRPQVVEGRPLAVRQGAPEQRLADGLEERRPQRRRCR